MRSSSSVVVYATQYMPTGGIESHLSEFCTQLARAGTAVDLVILNSKMLPETEVFFRQVCRRVYLGKQKYPTQRLLWLMKVGVKLLTGSYTALYTNGRGASVGLFANLMRRRQIWVHHHHMAGDLEDQAAWGRSYRQSLQSANRVVACSTLNAHDMTLALGRDILVVPCFSRQVLVAAKPAKNLRFGYYGRLIPEKGVDVLCKLSEEAEFQNIEFHLWGEGAAYPPAFFEQYPRVRYHGTYNGAEGLSRVLGNIDAFLLLSTHSEGLPISLLEAMGAGIPWLATNRGGVADIACDPQATRLLTAIPTYNQIKIAVLSFAVDLQLGNIKKEKQMLLYQQRFSAPALRDQWMDMLTLKSN